MSKRKYPYWYVKVWKATNDENNPSETFCYDFDTEEEAKEFFDSCKCNSRFPQIDLYIEYEEEDKKLWVKESTEDGVDVWPCQ